MINKNIFKKKFPDVEVQNLTTTVVLSRAEIEKRVLALVDGFGTGLLYYNYSGKELTVYTSEIFKDKLAEMPKGALLSDPNTGKQCTVVSEPYIMCCEMSISVDFASHPEAYSCTYFM